MQSAEHPLQPEELMAYLDGELAPDKLSAVRAHVAGCQACQKLSGELTLVSRDLATWTVGRAPTGLSAETLMPALPARSSWRPAWMPAWAMYSASVFAAAVVLVVVSTMQRFDSAQDSSSDAPTGLSAMTVRSSAPNVAAAERTEHAPTSGAPIAAVVGSVQPASGPLVVRTASLRLVVENFDAARKAIDDIVARVGGFLGDVNVSGTRPDARMLTATLRIPSARLDDAIASAKAIGKVVAETQNAEDVTEQVLDLDARLANGRTTEKRLTGLLLTQTGKLEDVLAAERELARVREEIERLDAQRKNVERRVTYATVTVQVQEEHKATLDLGPQSLSRRLRNAFVDGFGAAFESAIEALLVAVRIGPVITLWALVIGGPIYLVSRRRRRIERSA
jgi:anti-sigma factor RsiW